MGIFSWFESASHRQITAEFNPHEMPYIFNLGYTKILSWFDLIV